MKVMFQTTQWSRKWRQVTFRNFKTSLLTLKRHSNKRRQIKLSDVLSDEIFHKVTFQKSKWRFKWRFKPHSDAESDASDVLCKGFYSPKISQRISQKFFYALKRKFPIIDNYYLLFFFSLFFFAVSFNLVKTVTYVTYVTFKKEIVDLTPFIAIKKVTFRNFKTSLLTLKRHSKRHSFGT